MIKMKRRSILKATLALSMASALPAVAFAQTAALNPPVSLTVGYQKVGHLAPMILIADDLKKQGVEIKLVEFARYADARTALLAGSLDVASIGPADLAIALANGSTNLVGIMGVGSSPKYVIAKKGLKFDSWDDIKGKKIAIAPGSAVWFQFAATLTEKGIPYNSFNSVNIQGGGANFDAALEKGEVDAIVTWEPFESIPVMKGYGYFAKNLDYSISKSVGAELGMLAASKEVATTKRAAVERVVNAYVAKMKELEASPAKFATAISQLTGLEADVSAEIAKVIKLGPVITPDQIKRQAKAFNELGVIPKDVSGDIEKYWDASFLEAAMKK
jgi:sulfonate transport system substrate-binding protein